MNHINSCHIQEVGDYVDSTTAKNGYPAEPHYAIKNNIIRYNLFKNGSAGIKHKGNQLLTGRNPGGGEGFDNTNKDWGDKIHHNIFIGLDDIAIRGKQDFVQIYNNIMDSCSGGVLIVDNMLWGGRIFDESDQAVSTEGVRELTRLIANDAAWIATVVPVGDGLLIAYKK